MRMTIVRISVATSGFMSATPILAKMAVSAANTADNSAHICHAAIVRVSHSVQPQVTRAAGPSTKARLTAARGRTTFRRELGEPRQGAERPAGAVGKRGLATL